MTTRLEGAKTYFLPFNQGSSGAGRVGGAGNPVNPNGYDTAYLWEEVLAKDRLQELLHKYMHLEQKTDEAGRVVEERMIFPRYHQLDVVTKLLADVKAHGAGRNYLIQHSAGSGKSNSIAWLAHRLSGLHNEQNEKIFQSVIIVTDRRVLDRQLQHTVDQFDHVAGLVQKIDRNAQQLREAIEAGAGIIITTLQKFPMIYQEVRTGSRRFAVIVDEAHSSQTGEAAKKLKIALADTDAALDEYARREADAEAAREGAEDRLLRELAAQGQHGNLSFFAFTATPKEKTLQLFGTRGADGTYHPFHIYSMRQAIEEHFILDVLQNYMTYRMYYRIAKNIQDDPTLDTAAGLAAVRRFETLHPHNIAQKTAVMLEHFLHVTRRKIGGRAKAMVVTPSRLHAVRYLKEFRRQLAQRGVTDVQALVAFSGEVTDDGISYTEEGMNRTRDGAPVKEGSLPDTFHEDGYGLLIVAEKYQTGFDEPLLHTMFVDKKLSGVKAVQTLSRLNRTARGKEDTFVLDFVNSAEDIQKSFAPYYEETMLEEETDPNVVYDLRQTLEEYGVCRREDVYQFAELFFHQAVQREGDLGRLQGYLQHALDRYAALPEDRQQSFKSTLSRFNRIYAFITQVCRLFDKELHGFSVYARFLAKMLPKDTTERLDLSGQISLEYYRLEKEFAGPIELESSEGGAHPIKGDAGRGKEKKEDPLTVIIQEINDRYGTNFTEMDKVLQQLAADYTSQPQWQDCARNNDFKTFLSIFGSDFEKTAAARYAQNEEFFTRLFNTPEMMDRVRRAVGQAVYDEFRSGI